MECLDDVRGAQDRKSLVESLSVDLLETGLGGVEVSCSKSGDDGFVQGVALLFYKDSVVLSPSLFVFRSKYDILLLYVPLDVSTGKKTFQTLSSVCFRGLILLGDSTSSFREES